MTLATIPPAPPVTVHPVTVRLAEWVAPSVTSIWITPVSVPEYEVITLDVAVMLVTVKAQFVARIACDRRAGRDRGPAAVAG